jgi:hypothetical protein
MLAAGGVKGLRRFLSFADGLVTCSCVVIFLRRNFFTSRS